MLNAPANPAACIGPRALARITGFFWAVLAAAVILALMILLLPGTVFLALSNYLQIIAAITGSLVFLCIWYRGGKQEAFLYAALGLGIWGISNIAWYLNVLMGFRALIFPSTIDLGMIASFLLLAVAFKKGLPKTKVAPQIQSGILAVCLIIPAMVIVSAGLNASTVITLAYFLACGAFLMVGLQHSLASYRNLLIGSVLFAVTFMIYPLREMLFVQNPVLSIIGTFVSAGFSLMVIGWLSRN